MGLHLIADLQDAYDRFIVRVKSSGIVWGLRSEDGDYSCCESHENPEALVILFWSDKAYARQIGKKYWPDYALKELEIDLFTENFIPTMGSRGFYVGLNYNSDLAGLEIDPNQLARDLEKAS